MRLLLTGQIVNNVFQPHNKSGIQGFIYQQLQKTPFNTIHDQSGFRYFCFSDPFPLKEFHQGGTVNLLISSPWNQFLRTVYEQLEFGSLYHWGGWRVKLLNKKLFDIRLPYAWITGSPILLRYDPSGKGDTYFSFDRPKHSFQVFLQRLSENAIKKYQGFYGDFPPLTQPLFQELVYDKTVVIPVNVKDQVMKVITTKWKCLRLPPSLNKIEKDFYKFLLDAGLGERNALGFGFVNPLD